MKPRIIAADSLLGVCTIVARVIGGFVAFASIGIGALSGEAAWALPAILGFGLVEATRGIIVEKL